MTSVQCIARIELICGDAGRTADFYRAAFDFTPDSNAPTEGSARTIGLRLGDQAITLLEGGPNARRYPAGADGASLLFQHFAIVVGDMAAAHARLAKQSGWTPLSTAGPQRLPASSGGVTAFKFRDPDGHPLELLAFPAGSGTGYRQSADMFQGIDHSALSVADTARSIAFYRSLGLTVAGGSINKGPEQERLDGLPGAHVDVTSLALPDQSRPHLELLCYAGVSRRTSDPAAPGDVASTRLVFTVDTLPDLQSLCDQHAAVLISPPRHVHGQTVRAMMRDPDGHLIVLESSSRASRLEE